MKFEIYLLILKHISLDVTDNIRFLPMQIDHIYLIISLFFMLSVLYMKACILI
jgi:hypothetical protein